MAHFAEIDANNVVIRVLVVDNKDITIDGIQSEQAGIDFLASLGLGSNWIQTSYNANIRKKFAGAGDIYDPTEDVFTMAENNAPHNKIPWGGIFTPTSPSILIDSAPRSANQFFNEVLVQAFPQAFHRWGYLHQHNSESFAKGIGKFDVVATIIRNPIDSVASSMLAFDLTTQESIIAQLHETLKIFTAIKDNKTNVFIFDFNDITADPTIAISEIAMRLGVTAEPYNAETITELLKIYEINSTYALPIGNNASLDEAKNTLANEAFAELLTQCTNIYKELIA
jgi:hypothetical protein